MQESCAAYTYADGMWAVTLTDFIQMLILAIGMIITFLVVLREIGGWEYFVAHAGDWAGMPPFALTSVGDAGFYGYTRLLGWMHCVAQWISIGLGSIPAQDLMQRVLSAKDEKVASRSCYFAAVLISYDWLASSVAWYDDIYNKSKLYNT